MYIYPVSGIVIVGLMVIGFICIRKFKANARSSSPPEADSPEAFYAYINAGRANRTLPFPEVCYYCGFQAHPLTVYSRKTAPNFIHVCEFRLVPNTEGGIGLVAWHECKNKAIADGYVFRLDLTPLR